MVSDESVHSNNTGATLDAPASANHRASMLCLKLPLLFLTFDLPGFYESFAASLGPSVLSFGIIGSMSDQVRKFSSVLLAFVIQPSLITFCLYHAHRVLVTALFKPSAQDGSAFWFCISSSLVLAVMGLVGSTILAIVSSHLENKHLSVDMAMLHFHCWTVGDLFSFPTICTAWGTIIFIITIIIDAMRPIVSENDAVPGSRSTVAKVGLLMMICFAALRFGFFVLHIRRVCNALGRSVNEEHV